MRYYRVASNSHRYVVNIVSIAFRFRKSPQRQLDTRRASMNKPLRPCRLFLELCAFADAYVSLVSRHVYLDLYHNVSVTSACYVYGISNSISQRSLNAFSASMRDRTVGLATCDAHRALVLLSRSPWTYHAVIYSDDLFEASPTHGRGNACRSRRLVFLRDA